MSSLRKQEQANSGSSDSKDSTFSLSDLKLEDFDENVNSSALSTTTAAAKMGQMLSKQDQQEQVDHRPMHAMKEKIVSSTDSLMLERFSKPFVPKTFDQISPNRPTLNAERLQVLYERLTTDVNLVPPFSLERARMHHSVPSAHEGEVFWWTKVSTEEEQLELYVLLRKLRQTPLRLQRNGYQLDPKEGEAVAAVKSKNAQKCKNCGLVKNKCKKEFDCKSHQSTLWKQVSKTENACQCCDGSEGCVTAYHHWDDPSIRFEDFYNSSIEAPEHDPANLKKKAIVIDCEMVGVEYGLSELARLCVVDCLTGEVLIDVYVEPVHKVVDYRTKYSGITLEILEQAKEQGNCLENWCAARAALLKFVDKKTILVGASLQNDLRVLRLVSTNVVDCSLTAQRAIGNTGVRSWGLKTLAKELLNLDIQGSLFGHDPLEDCLATREVVLFMATEELGLAHWAAQKREQELHRITEEVRERHRKALEEINREEALENGEDSSKTDVERYQEFLEEAYGYKAGSFRNGDSVGQEFFATPEPILTPGKENTEW